MRRMTLYEHVVSMGSVASRCQEKWACAPFRGRPRFAVVNLHQWETCLPKIEELHELLPGPLARGEIFGTRVDANRSSRRLPDARSAESTRGAECRALEGYVGSSVGCPSLSDSGKEEQESGVEQASFAATRTHGAARELRSRATNGWFPIPRGWNDYGALRCLHFSFRSKTLCSLALVL